MIVVQGKFDFRVAAAAAAFWPGQIVDKLLLSRAQL